MAAGTPPGAAAFYGSSSSSVSTSNRVTPNSWTKRSSRNSSRRVTTRPFSFGPGDFIETHHERPMPAMDAGTPLVIVI